MGTLFKEFTAMKGRRGGGGSMTNKTSFYRKRFFINVTNEIIRRLTCFTAALLDGPDVSHVSVTLFTIITRPENGKSIG